MKIGELFLNWVDFDVAEYYLACLIGLVRYDDSWDEFRRTKGVYNTKNEVGDMLYLFLEKLVEVELLEKDEIKGYRWNKDYDAYWLNPNINSAIKLDFDGNQKAV